jgi:hypothetical protein
MATTDGRTFAITSEKSATADVVVVWVDIVGELNVGLMGGGVGPSVPAGELVVVLTTLNPGSAQPEMARTDIMSNTALINLAVFIASLPHVWFHDSLYHVPF